MLIPNRSNLIDRNDVRMFKLRCGFRLHSETLYIVIAREIAGQDHFESNDTIEASLPSFINNPHPTSSNLEKNLVVSEDFGISRRWQVRENFIGIGWYLRWRGGEIDGGIGNRPIEFGRTLGEVLGCVIV